MAIYVDDAFISWRNNRWCHLISDEATDDELHAFAQKIGLKRQWYQGDHYDVSAGMRWTAIREGAIPIGKRELAIKHSDKRRRLKGLPPLDLNSDPT